ncbi:hypothetical protein ACFY1P_20835 [Streptomyces sp. NPDC001407]|uniref:hypothetical protein n=1 Tax=Streptomyces sp. NPDC001407 TaxID=3364573 RepID=UPI0036C8D8E2
MSFHLQPLANGLRTDHPVPGIPFVDDSHLPLDDGGEAIEAVGRNAGRGMWGRFDPERVAGGWRAFTTDPSRHDLTWAVRSHPEHGRTVLLIRSGQAADLHSEWHNGPLLFRAGGYWWDGTHWYRPGQVWDRVAEEFERRKARAAVAVTAADLLDGSTSPERAAVLNVAGVDKEAPGPENWADHLALWAQLSRGAARALPLEKCVVNVSCPELAGDQLIGVPEMAALGGIGASTLRAYIARNESDVPAPQALVAGRAMWSRPVGQDWAESRRRSSEGVRAVVSASGEHNGLSLGAESVRQRFTEDFFRALWEKPGRRSQWVLRSRNQEAVRDVADDLACTVALSLDRILPPDLLRTTVRHAILDDLGQDLGGRDGAEVKGYEIRLTMQVAKMLDWLIRHHPDVAQHTIGDTLRQIESRWGIPSRVAGEGLRASLEMDSELEETVLTEYLDRVLPTATSGS